MLAIFTTLTNSIKTHKRQWGISAILIAVLGITFIVYPIGAGARSDTPAKVKLLSYNILIQPYGDSEYPDHPWAKRKQRIASYLNGSKASVIGIQEARLPSQRADLMKYMAKYWRMTNHTGEDGENAIIWNTETQTILGQGYNNFWHAGKYVARKDLSYDTGNFWVTWVYLQDKASGVKYYVFNTHLDHRSNELRRDQAAALVAFINKKVPNTATPVFFMGDFNTTAGTPAYDVILGNNYLDSLREAFVKKNENSTTFAKFSANPTGKIRIDHIFYRENPLIVADQYVTHANVYSGSDHLPIYAWFTLYHPGAKIGINPMTPMAADPIQPNETEKQTVPQSSDAVPQKNGDDAAKKAAEEAAAQKAADEAAAQKKAEEAAAAKKRAEEAATQKKADDKKKAEDAKRAVEEAKKQVAEAKKRAEAAEKTKQADQATADKKTAEAKKAADAAAAAIKKAEDAKKSQAREAEKRTDADKAVEVAKTTGQTPATIKKAEVRAANAVEAYDRATASVKVAETERAVAEDTAAKMQSVADSAQATAKQSAAVAETTLSQARAAQAVLASANTQLMEREIIAGDAGFSFTKSLTSISSSTLLTIVGSALSAAALAILTTIVIVTRRSR